MSTTYQYYYSWQEYTAHSGIDPAGVVTALYTKLYVHIGLSIALF